MQFTKHKIMACAASVILASLMLLSCKKPAEKISPPGADSSNGKYSGKILIAMGDHDFPPFEYLNENSRPSGFNIDILRGVARVMNLNIDIKLAPWRDVRASLEDGKIDIITGLYRSPDREKTADFSIPHFISSYVIFVRKGSDIRNVKDLKGKEVIVQEGDLGHEYVLQQGMAGRIITKVDWDETLSSLASGEGDCAIAALLQGEILKNRLGLDNVEALSEPILQKKYCIAVRKGDAELLARLNEGLGMIKSSGEYDSIYEKWFGVYEERSFMKNPLVRIFMSAALLLLILTGGIYLWNIFLKRRVREKTEALNLELEKSNEMKKLLEEALEESSRAEEAALLARTESEKANEAKSIFLAGVSHELRTPLNGIIGMSQLLEATTLTDEQKGLLEMLRLSADNLLRILTDLIDYSRIGSGKFRLEISPVNLDEFAGSIATVMAIMAIEKGLNFRLKKGKPGISVMTDRDRIGQIIFNLVNNAVKYTREGDVTLEVSYDNGLKIETTDTGAGIPADRLSEIFTPFAQIKGEGEAKNRGLGLGLSIVRRIVKMMDGTIDVHSVPGEGSRFTVKIPCEAAFCGIPSEGMTQSGDPAEKHAAGNGISVLIVEDEVINRIYLERILARRGFSIDAAVNGREAVEKHRGSKYDVIFMDINMPEIDGYDATRLIREHEKSTGMKRVPIIAVTAYAYPEDITKCIDAGMDSYLAKPYDAVKLVDEIYRFCGKSKLLLQNSNLRN